MAVLWAIKNNKSLQGANLRNALLLHLSDPPCLGEKSNSLNWIDCRGADFQGASFEGVSCWRADFRFARLWFSDFQGASLDHALLKVSQLKETTFTAAQIKSMQIED